MHLFSMEQSIIPLVTSRGDGDDFKGELRDLFVIKKFSYILVFIQEGILFLSYYSLYLCQHGLKEFTY